MIVQDEIFVFKLDEEDIVSESMELDFDGDWTLSSEFGVLFRLIHGRRATVAA